MYYIIGIGLGAPLKFLRRPKSKIALKRLFVDHGFLVSYTI
jgi:hypothetical protein